MEDPVVPIHRKDLDSFEGHSIGSTGWFNIDHEGLKRKFYTLEPEFYFILKRILEGKILKYMKHLYYRLIILI